MAPMSPGRRPCGGVVRYRIRYQGTLVILPVSGTIAEGEVTANEKGQWSVSNFSLPNPTGVTKVTYVAEVISVGAAGETSQPAAWSLTSVEFKR
jgi:hypothetical protein